MAISDILVKADAFFQSVVGYLNTVVTALVILLSGFIAGRLVDRAMHKLLLRLNFDDICYTLFGARRNYARATRRTIVYMIYLVTAYFVLLHLSLETFALVLVLSVLVLIVLVSAVLASIDIVPNIVGRRQLLRMGIDEGSRVNIRDDTGSFTAKIQQVTFIDTHLKRSNGDVIFYPNAALLKAKITKK